MQAYLPSVAAYTRPIHSPSTATTSTQAYYPSMAAHTVPHLPTHAATTSTTHSTPYVPPPAADLIAALQNPDTLRTDALTIATINAYEALVFWQNEHMALAEQVRKATTHGKPNNPRKLEDPAKFDERAQKLADKAMATYQTLPAKPPSQSSQQPARQPKAPKATYKSNLGIEVNVPDPTKPTGKRVRKATKFYDAAQEAGPSRGQSTPNPAITAPTPAPATAKSPPSKPAPPPRKRAHTLDAYSEADPSAPLPPQKRARRAPITAKSPPPKPAPPTKKRAFTPDAASEAGSSALPAAKKRLLTPSTALETDPSAPQPHPKRADRAPSAAKAPSQLLSLEPENTVLPAKRARKAREMFPPEPTVAVKGSMRRARVF